MSRGQGHRTGCGESAYHRLLDPARPGSALPQKNIDLDLIGQEGCQFCLRGRLETTPRKDLIF